MAIQPLKRYDPGEVITLPLFETAHRGFGDEHMVQDGRYHRVHGSIDARWPNQLRLGLRLRELVGVNFDYTPIWASEWEDTSGNPRPYYLVGAQLRYVQNGADAQAGGGDLAGTATDGMLDDDGSGVPYIYMGFGGTSSDQSIQRMNRAGTLSQATSIPADKLLSLNGYAYRSITPTGGTANCQVSVCPPGAARFTASNWGAGVTVGFAGTNVNKLLALRQSPVAIKPEGIFVYSESLDRWTNLTPAWESYVHTDTGKVAYSLGDQIVVGMGGGGAVIFDGFSARPFDPVGLNSSPGLHTTPSTLQALGGTRHWVVGVTDIPSKVISAGDALQFRSYVSSSFSDGSSDVRDTNKNTAHTFSIGSSSDELYIMWSRPFSAVKIDLGTVNAVSRTMTVSVGLTNSTWQAVTARDFTSLAGAPLGQDGSIILMEDPIAAGWQSTTIDSSTGYWMKLSFSGALTGSMTIRSLKIQPWYPAIDTALFPLDGLDRGGCFPHILYGRAEPQENVWHDMASFDEPDKVGAVLLTEAGGSTKNHLKSLILFSRFSIWELEVTPEDHPSVALTPYTHDVGLFEGNGIIPAQGQLVALRAIRIEGREFDPATVQGAFYYTWDYGKPWSRLSSRVLSLPTEIGGPPDQSNRGSLFRWAWGMYNGGASFPPGQPLTTSIEADFEVIGAPLDRVQERVAQTRTRF